ncbi:MAG: DUF3048 domain-containing protein [Acidimicrobiales bacterium]
MPTPPRRSRSRLGAAAVAVLLVAGCGGGEEAAPSSAAPPSTTRLPTTSAPPTTAAPAISVPFPEGTVPAPLTGLPIDPARAGNRAVIIKVDNHRDARPQTGLDRADIVFDYRAEGVTRFAAVFQSELADPVGPVRSSRTGDFDILSGFDHPVYGSSGGNDGVIHGLRRLPIFAMTNWDREEYYRDPARRSPHDLMVDTTVLYAAAERRWGSELSDLPGPTPWFSYALPGEPGSVGRPVDGPVTVDFRGSPVVTWEWDPARVGWARGQDGHPHLTSDGVQIAPANVVIMVTSYGTSSADVTSPEVRSLGGGDLFVLTGGQVIEGTWTREAATEPPTLVDTGGAPLVLTAGRTWVLYPEKGQVRVPTAVP